MGESRLRSHAPARMHAVNPPSVYVPGMISVACNWAYAIVIKFQLISFLPESAAQTPAG